MKLIRGLHNLRPEHQGCVATIGNFDGVHLGHQAMFAALRNKAAEMNAPSMVIVFEPQPAEFFKHNQTPARLTRLREKLEILKSQDLDFVLVLTFNASLAAMSPIDFINTLLVEKLAIVHLYVGDDFRFGKGREGNFSQLVGQGNDYGFGVDSMDTHADTHTGSRVSSTRIRIDLCNGALDDAARCLGRPYHICGRVGHGDKRGRTMNFPTINIDLHRRVTPIVGVYAVRVYGLSPEPWPGVANVGNRPTVTREQRYLLEVHLLDFDREVYGEQVRVEFVERIRSEQKFENMDKLTQRIQMDADRAREIFNLQKPDTLSFDPHSQLT